ncbi:MAG TPA: ABC transporter permease [Gemmataceae bacterium]|nr:ABC transporter permease [Gemmataceae bacterium]
MIRFICILLGIGFFVLLCRLLSSDKGRRSFVLAMRSLWLHKLRAFLSVLGIIIGTGAVIVLMGVGEGTMRDALEDIMRQGATNVIIRSVKPPENTSGARRTRVARYGLTNDDYDRLRIISTVVDNVPMRIFSEEIRHLDKKPRGRVVATTPSYFVVNKCLLSRGRFLTDQDNRTMENVCVLGNGIADKVFPFTDPLGETVVLNKSEFKVVGVLQDRIPTGAVGGSTQTAEDFNDDVYIPLNTCQVRYGEKKVTRSVGSWSIEQVELSQVTLTIDNMDDVRGAGQVVRDLLARYHDEQDYAVTIPLDRLEAAERERDRLTFQLAVVASISLFVGGIGIMNIMLATVTERTREIGIRRALGAKRRDITLQFLIEAVVQTSVGGIIGVGAGLFILIVAPWIYHLLSNQHWPAQVNGDSILYSLVVAVGVGMGFGLYPAWRAALLDPIEALRHE